MHCHFAVHKELASKTQRGSNEYCPSEKGLHGLFKVSGSGYLCGQGLQGFSYQLFSQSMLIFGGKTGVAHRMRDSNSRNDPVSPYRLGYSGNCSHMNNWNTVPFDFFYHRCTATSTGPSGGGENNTINTRLF